MQVTTRKLPVVLMPSVISWMGEFMTFPDLKKPRPGDFCLLCSEEPSFIGVFVPQKPEAWGGDTGIPRLFRYCLCSKCHKKPDTAENVEKIILAELAGGGVHHV